MENKFLDLENPGRPEHLAQPNYGNHARGAGVNRAMLT